VRGSVAAAGAIGRGRARVRPNLEAGLCVRVGGFRAIVD
jgi:hypothetical protein